MNVSLRFFGGMSRIAFCSANTDCGRSSGSRRRHQSMTSSTLSEYWPAQIFFAETRWSSCSARVGRLRRERREAREHRRAGAVDVGPRARAGRARGTARARRSRACTSARASGRLLVSVWRAAPKSSSTGAAVGAQVDVRRLDVEVQQLVRVHLAQAVQQMHEHVPDEALGHLVLAHLDLLLQRAAALVAHHHVHRLVRAEEVQHAHDVRVVDLRERAAFLEEALHAVAERRQVLGRRGAHDVALGAQHQRGRQVLLDRDRRAGLVERAVDDRKAAAADLPVDPVVQQLVAAGKGLVGDGHGRIGGRRSGNTLAIRVPDGRFARLREVG